MSKRMLNYDMILNLEVSAVSPGSRLIKCDTARHVCSSEAHVRHNRAHAAAYFLISTRAACSAPSIRAGAQ
jgi:hypothetical protein